MGKYRRHRLPAVLVGEQAPQAALAVMCQVLAASHLNNQRLVSLMVAVRSEQVPAACLPNLAAAGEMVVNQIALA